MTFRVLIVLIGLVVLSTSGITPFAERPNIPCKPRCWDRSEVLEAGDVIEVVIDGRPVDPVVFYGRDRPQVSVLPGLRSESTTAFGRVPKIIYHRSLAHLAAEIHRE